MDFAPIWTRPLNALSVRTYRAFRAYRAWPDFAPGQPRKRCSKEALGRCVYVKLPSEADTATNTGGVRITWVTQRAPPLLAYAYAGVTSARRPRLSGANSRGQKERSPPFRSREWAEFSRSPNTTLG